MEESSSSQASSQPHAGYNVLEQVLDRESLIQKHIEQLSQMKLQATNHDKLAYFRACNGDIQQATHRLQATLEWRKQGGISQLLKDPTWLTREKEMRKTLWYDYLGADRHGRPILVERGGRWDVRKVLSSIWPHYYAQNYPDGTDTTEQDKIDEESFVKLHCMSCEIMLQTDRHCSTPDNPVKDDRGMIIIMDLKGLRPWHLDPRLATAFGKVAAVNSTHYPDTLAHVWVVNAPYLFNGLSRMVQPFLDPDTVGKFHVSSGIPPELAQCVGTDCLPEELGGSRKSIFPYAQDSPMSDYPKK
ncbi:unnamed protein product [Cylindrotheca closterium]|uniref:CRAL-TRIO domain-containing protein n=1 Tax=Cylindrotheca closterium TaxID=2856 RepID=A0AAD2CIP9_9STRA|nr:unnamed protein product [Cylindrotheca closterium]